MIKLLILLIFLNIFDTISTMILIGIYGLIEINPILNYLIGKFGLIIIPIIKIPPIALLIYGRNVLYKFKYLLFFVVFVYIVVMSLTNFPLLIENMFFN